MINFILAVVKGQMKHTFTLNCIFRYGDKSPRSIIARLFAIMWILVGITIFSMFTASLTTILQNLAITKVQDLTGKSVRSLF